MPGPGVAASKTAAARNKQNWPKSTMAQLRQTQGRKARESGEACPPVPSDGPPSQLRPPVANRRYGIRGAHGESERAADVQLGLVGGIGIAATVIYHQRLAAAMTARGEAKLDLTIVHGDIHELI